MVTVYLGKNRIKIKLKWRESGVFISRTTMSSSHFLIHHKRFISGCGSATSLHQVALPLADLYEKIQLSMWEGDYIENTIGGFKLYLFNIVPAYDPVQFFVTVANSFRVSFSVSEG